MPVRAAAAQAGDNLVLALAEGTLVLRGTRLAEIDGGDFVF